MHNEYNFNQDYVRKRKLTTDSNLSFLQSEKDKSDNEEFANRNNLKNKLRERIELNKLDHDTFMENESKLIKQNFKLLNDNIINLLSSGRLKLKIKDYITERTVYLLLELWNLFDIKDNYFQEYCLDNQDSINGLIEILITFISKDSKIFKEDYKNYLANILRLCNILISICSSKSKFYLDFLHLIYKISDTQSRLILCVILKQINEPMTREILLKLNSLNTNSKDCFDIDNYYSKFNEIYTVIIRLNITKQGKSLEFTDDLDVDLALENLNIINEEFCNQFSTVHLEPLIYQITSLANFSDDFSIQTLGIAKIKIIFDKVLHDLNHILNKDSNKYDTLYKIELESFGNILKVFLNLLNLLNYNTHLNRSSKNNFSGENYMSMNKIKQEKIKKNILDLFSYINNKIYNNEDISILEKLSKAENQTKSNLDIYSISTINYNMMSLNSEIYSKQSYFNDYMNSISLLLCRDLFLIKSEKGDYDFFEGIMNLKFDVRSSVLVNLRNFLEEKKIKYFSLLNIIIPVIKSFLNFEANDSNKNNQNNKKDNFDVFHKRNDINAIIDNSIDLLEPIAKMLTKDDFLAFLMHFFRRITKINNQDSSRSYEENRFAFEKLYEILSRLLECLSLFKFEFISEYDFDAEFNKSMRELITEYKNKANLTSFVGNESITTNEKITGNSTEEKKQLNKLDNSKVNQFTNNKSYSKDLFKDSFNKVAEIYEEKQKSQRYKPKQIKEIENESFKQIQENKKQGSFKLNEFSKNLTTQIFNMLRNMLIDNYRKDKTKKYYIRNFVIKPFFLILKKMDPRTLKYELLSLVYEVINNLKNKDLDVREKARQAIRILIETLGPFISNVLFEQLKSQLTSGYQRYIMGYTCNYIIIILNKLYLNFKEIEEHGEAIALKKIIKENQIDLELNEFEEDNENKVINLNNQKSNSLNEDENEKQNNYQNIINEIKYERNLQLNKNLDFVFLNRYKQFTKKDLELVFDFSIGIVVPILLEELFGEVAEEKEIEQLIKKYKEGKEVKAYSSFTLIATRMDFKTGILNLIFPIRNFVLEKESNNSIINKINEVMNFITKGLKENITMRIEDIILISYSLINIGLEINIKNSKEIKQNKKVTIKGSDFNESIRVKNDYQSQKNELVSLQLGTNSKKRFSIEIAKKFIMEKNDIIISNLFTQFGLDIFFLSIKKNVFDYNSLKSKLDNIKDKQKLDSFKLEKSKEEEQKNEALEGNSGYDSDSDDYQNNLFDNFNFENKSKLITHHHKHKSYYDLHRVNFSESEFKEIINQIEVLLYSVICCLKISSNNILSKSLKILTKLFDSRLFVIKKNLKKIGSNLFKNLGIINLSDSDKTIAQTILSCISEILRKFTFFEVTDTQMKVLINFLKIYINNLEIKSYIFACLFAIIKRKFLHPCIYDMIDYIQETYLISFDEATKSLCENIIIEFLNNYPLEDKRKQNHINFFIINLESNTRNCILNSLRMIRKIIDFTNSDLKKGNDEIDNKLKYKKKNSELTQNNINQISHVVKDYIDFMLLKLLYLIANSSDFEVKNLSSKIIQEMFDHMINKEKYELYLAKIIEWIKIEEKVKSRIRNRK